MKQQVTRKIKIFLRSKIQTILRKPRALQKNVDNLWILINKIVLYEKNML